MPLLRHLAALVIAGAASLLPPQASGTDYAPETWQELASKADFVGVVRCVDAGGIVARYCVEKSLHGPRKGTLFNLGRATDYWEPQFPIALCGERFLVMAYKTRAYHRVGSPHLNVVPLWWRDIPADYGAARRVWKLGNDNRVLVDSRYRSLDDFEKELQTFLSSSEEEKELATLLSAAQIHLRLIHPGDYHSPGVPTDNALFDQLKQCADVSSFVRLLLNPRDPAVLGREASISIFYYGGRATLEALNHFEPESGDRKDRGMHLLKSHLQRSLAESSPQDFPHDKQRSDKKPRVTKDEILQARKDIENWPANDLMGKAFDLLAVQEPDAVSDMLLTWHEKETGTGKTSGDGGYVLASTFCWQCGRDREAQLTKLLRAETPFIRVAAAVYLCFENRNVGMQSLREFTKLKGDPGGWAALVLANHGDKEAVPRAIELLAIPKWDGMDSVPHGNLQERLRVLLSNSAEHSHLPQPPSTGNFDTTQQWWAQHQEAITLHDPWVRLLDKQKVD